MNKTKLLALSLFLGVMTGFGVSGLNHLPQSRARDLFTDILAFPGGLLASIFFPEGVHTGGGTVSWGWVALAGNLLIYTLGWFLVLWFWGKRRQKNG